MLHLIGVNRYNSKQKADAFKIKYGLYFQRSSF